VTIPVVPVIVLEDFFPHVHHGTLPRISASDQADGHALARAMDRRRLDEVHHCAFCGERARAALGYGPSDLVGPPRWLDLCAPHDKAVRDMACRFQARPVPDGEIIERYEDWARQHGTCPECS
jgi:hypothetical protein